MPASFDQPGAGSDCILRIKVGDAHKRRLVWRAKRGESFASKQGFSPDNLKKQMRLLDRYLLGELLVPLFYCLAGFQIFWTAFDLFSNLKDYQSLGLGWAQVVRLYFLKTPELLTTVVPIALLLALLYTLTHLAKANELTAMRAAGISLLRISVPFFAVAFFAGVFLFVLSELIAPKASAKSERVMNSMKEENGEWMNNLDFRDERLGQFWHIKKYNPATGEMEQPSVDWIQDNIRTVVDAARGVWTNGGWTFYFAERKTYYPATNDLPTSVIATNILSGEKLGGSPRQIRVEIKIAQLDQLKAAKQLQLSLWDILEYKKLHPDMNDSKAPMILTQFHGRIAQPFTCLVVVLMALPFGISGARRNAFVGVAGSVGICFLYFILMRWGLALGTSAHIPAIIAAWLPNIAFTVGGLILLRRAA